jgi:hypothetical protein
MAGAIMLSRRWISISWKGLLVQVAGGGLIYVVTVLLLRDAFAMEMLEIVKRNLPFVKKWGRK